MKPSKPPPQPRSLRGRLMLSLAAVVTGLWLVAAAAAGIVLRRETDYLFDSALQEVAQRVLPLAYLELLNRETAGETPSQLVPSVEPHSEMITYIVRDSAGRILMQSHDAVAEDFPADLAPGFHSSARLRLYTEKAVSGTLLVTTAEALDRRHAAVVKAIGALAWPLAAVLPLSLLAVWWLVGIAMRPLLAWRTEIETRDRGNLAPVGAFDLPSELAPIAIAVDSLIVRLRQALEAERGFAANAAHELRTPIAAALAQSQRLLVEVSPGPARDRAAAIESALRDLARLSEKLLQLAKADTGGLIGTGVVDLAEIVHHVCEDLSTIADADERLVVELPEPAAAMSLMDGDAFAILVRNLVENALKHGDASTPVDVTLSADGLLSVVNGGPSVRPEILARMARPFERGATRAKGSGLGLAIADAIAKGAGGHLELVSPASGRRDGFEARFRGPMIQDTAARATGGRVRQSIRGARD